MADMKGDGGGNTAEGFDAQEAFADKEREEDTYDDLPMSKSQSDVILSSLPE
ncbi:hypothetical protein DFJ74DRAFT_703278 [Hyaloraphidium curvatum]|nr:hypothetical protein DFJ74DRAFT_703278 [Hyaloraphidium curvatum]